MNLSRIIATASILSLAPQLVFAVPNTSTVSADKVKTGKISNYSEVSYKKISDEVGAELSEDRDAMLGDLNILWQSAVQHSETVTFAIYKLSNPNGEPVNSSAVKKILTPITNFAAVVGSSTSNPIAGTSALFGGGLLDSIMSDDSLINNKLSKVTDADLVLLVQKIDDLQQKLIKVYMDYISAIERLNSMDKIVSNRYKQYTEAQKMPVETAAVADVFYREAIDKQNQARQDLMVARTTLEQMVGAEAVISVDNKIKERLASAK